MPDESEQTLRTAWQKGSTQANANYVRRRITIDPITRLEGHGKIDIFLDEGGQVERAYFQVPELRGFEKFVQGRPAEEMPQITSRICGVCPTAHHMAATKALDHLYQVAPSPAEDPGLPSSGLSALTLRTNIPPSSSRGRPGNSTPGDRI